MALRIGTALPELGGATEWFGGTQAHAEAQAKGHPTLVHFWSVSCGTCKENMPRYEADTDVEAVREAIAQHNIIEVCAIDNEHKLKEAFQNDQGFVPAYYLFDSEGKLKSFAAGERGIDMLKSALDRLLASSEQLAADKRG